MPHTPPPSCLGVGGLIWPAATGADPERVTGDIGHRFLETFVSQLHLGNARRLFPMHNRRASCVFNVTRLFASVFHDCKWRCNFFLTQCVRTGRFMITTRKKSCTGTPPSLQMVNNFEPCNPLFRPPGSKLESGGDDPFCDTKAQLSLIHI